MSNTFIENIKKRRTIYNLGSNLPVAKEEITQTIQDAIKFSPSAFNSQSARVIILYGEESKKLWEIVLNALKPLVPEDKFEETEQKINSFAAGAGTALFFEDMSVIKGLQDAMPAFASNFALWSQHGTGISQFAVWTALANLQVGASLQHYGNLIEPQVKKQWNLPEAWSLIAQMPFGSIESPAGEKQSIPIDQRVRVI
ncbi:nitroreductase family protein [uncultured Sphaerochaeta sp.]|uniref:nitroreductase family protein n=1 Tax=uncultured Sphaerochaeta sp. TaxID=886478 RepID=UPI002A0A6D4A|nr:nitroreductase family protein [uncultured Sphaerochaeta sp.]